MQRNRDDCPLWFDDPDDFARLRDLLGGVDYTDRGVADALGVDDSRSLSGSDVPLLLRRTSGATRLETLIRLFLIGVPTDAEATRWAITPMTLDTWAEAGLVRVEGDSVVGLLQLLPFRELLLAFDRPHRIASGLKTNYVMGIGSSTLTLANATVRRPSEASLDLGTGCGFLAFLAAAHSRRVVAVDRNPRAVNLAAFNARLNDLSNVECLEGDLFEPVAGQEFDLVVSNPPFVISPERRYIYRDSGMLGDEVTRKIVEQVPALLRQGGFCQILCNWAHVAGEDWQQRLAGWFEGTGCDAWVMCTDTLDAAGYAAKWIRHTEHDDTEEFGNRFDRWMAYYEQERIEAVSNGLITMRRRDGAANWFRADDGPEKMLGPAGDCVVRGFELRDFLEAAQDDRQLIARRLRVSPDARLQQVFEPTPEGWSVVQSELNLVRGLAYSGSIDAYLARMITRCDGERSLGDLIGDLAASLGKDPAELIPTCLEVVRRLLERGFLLPAGQPTQHS